jgi:hypothetical protein
MDGMFRSCNILNFHDFFISLLLFSCYFHVVCMSFSCRCHVFSCYFHVVMSFWCCFHVFMSFLVSLSCRFHLFSCLFM